nr:hypothetical protein [Tanacetum cinerariifolium]
MKASTMEQEECVRAGTRFLGLAGGEWWSACGSRGKWWSGAEMGESGAVSGGGKNRKKVIITESTIRRDLQLEDAEGVDCLPNAAIFKQLTLMGDLQLEDAEGVDCLPNAAIFKQLTLMGYEKLSEKLTFYKAFFSPQWKFIIHNITKYISAKTTAWNKFSSTMASAVICLATNQKFNFSKYIFESMVKNLDNMNIFLMYPRVGKDFLGRVTPLFPTMMVQAQEEMGEGSGLSCQETIRDVVAQTRFERVSKISNDPLLVRINTPQSGEDSLKFNELMELCTNLQNRVLDLETTKTAQAMEIECLKWRVKKLKKRKRLRTHKLKRPYKVRLSARVESSTDEGLVIEDASKHRRISYIDADDDITLVSTHDEQMFDADQDLDGKEVTTAATTLIISIDEATLAQALAELKHEKPNTKAKGIVFYEAKESTTIITTLIPKPKSQVKDKGKVKMIEEHVKLKKKDQIQLDEEVALKLEEELQAKFEKEQRLTRKKLTNLKNQSFDSIQKMFDKAFKKVNTFVDYKTELIEVSSKKTKEKVIKRSTKRVGTEIEQESSMKQKNDDDKDTTEVKQLVNIISDE